jgi:hypothetical protein
MSEKLEIYRVLLDIDSSTMSVFSSVLDPKGKSLDKYEVRLDKEKTGNNINKIIDDTIDPMIKDGIDEKSIRIFLLTDISSTLISTEINNYKNHLTKEFLSVKDKNLNLLNDDDCVMDDVTKDSLVKSLAVVDKLVSKIK